jgi:trimethylamine--corrinoid protein Co-methyltransferase
MIKVLLGGMDLSENGQAMEAFEEVGPGKHFLGSAHTLSNFETAFYRSTVADNNSFEQWSVEGSLDTAQRANKIWKQMLADYEAPALDPAIDEALAAFMTEQKASFADRDY